MNILRNIHPAEGVWRAYLDGELPADRLAEMTRHLNRCVRCRSKLDQVQADSAVAAAKLGALQALAGVAPVPAMPPQLGPDASNESGQTRKEESTMGFAPRVARYIAAAALLILAGSLGFPSVRAQAAEWLSIFRVKESRVVRITADDLKLMGSLERNQPNAQALAGLFETRQVTAPKLEQDRPLGAVLDQGFEVPDYLPAGYQPGSGTIHTSGREEMRVDVDGFNALMAMAGSESRLPEELKGQVITLGSTRTVSFFYTSGEQTLTVAKAELPQITVSGGADARKVVVALMESIGREMGFSGDLQARMKGLVADGTLPLPVVEGSGAEVKIGSITGAYYAGQKTGTVAWTRGEHIYMVEGPLPFEELVKVAESIGK